ncbi:response regulator [Sphingomonas sp. PB2P12]|uniref:response regulator transcription factor n=1 Tax=Sphingomonas sandaracina TaxID=3096157 RepID=UPI002FC63016
MASIIYVEDNDLMGRVVQDILLSVGHAISVVSHGTRGFDAIVFGKPELIILDISLPGMSGLDVVRALRQLPATYLTPILMLSANRNAFIAEQALSAGANEFLAKPFSPDGLVSVVDAILDNHPFG